VVLLVLSSKEVEMWIGWALVGRMDVAALWQIGFFLF